MALSRNTEKNTEKKTTWTGNVVKNVKVVRAGWVTDNALAFNMIVNNMVQVNGCWYRTGTKDGKDYEIISLPQYKGNNGKYYNTVFFPISEELKSDIINQIEALL